MVDKKKRRISVRADTKSVKELCNEDAVANRVSESKVDKELLIDSSEKNPKKVKTSKLDQSVISHKKTSKDDSGDVNDKVTNAAGKKSKSNEKESVVASRSSSRIAAKTASSNNNVIATVATAESPSIETEALIKAHSKKRKLIAGIDELNSTRDANNPKQPKAKRVKLPLRHSLKVIDEVIKSAEEEFKFDDEQFNKLVSDYQAAEDQINPKSQLSGEELEEMLKKGVPAHVSKKKAEKIAFPPRAERGVIYIGHLPYGFYETALRRFFSQFGQICRLRVARNHKTGHSRHFAFVEFSQAEVAKLAAEAMHGYMMFGKTLKVDLVPPERVHELMFFQKVNAVDSFEPKMVIEEAEVDDALLKERTRQHLITRQEKWKSLGIDYDFVPVQ